MFLAYRGDTYVGTVFCTDGEAAQRQASLLWGEGVTVREVP